MIMTGEIDCHGERREVTLEPTGTCFDDMIEHMARLARAYGYDKAQREIRLCHGICLFSDGTPYSHAWVELKGKEVVFSALWNGQTVFATVMKAEFYAEHRIEDVSRYSPSEAARKNILSGMLGPWESRYLKLCKNYDPVKHESISP